MLANVVHPEQLSHYTLLAELVQLDDEATAPSPFLDKQQYRAVTGAGIYPAATTDVVRGVIQYFSEDSGAPEADEFYVSAVTEGLAIIQVEPGQTLIEDSPIAVNANGQAVLGNPASDYVLGYARNASTGSVVAQPHYIVIKLA